jgi:alkylation response protein AidB-like acyl-CoA dehydrogenase
MSTVFTQAHEDLRALVRDFAAKELAPRAAQLDRDRAFPTEAWKRAGEMGLLGVMVPAEYGGEGLDHVAFSIFVEELARADGAVALVLDVTAGIVSECILMAGTEGQKREYLPPFCRAEKLAAFCLSEPGSGSDAGALRTRAAPKGGHYVLNGTKTFITNGGVADVYLVLARTDPAKGARGISAFLIEKGTPGLSYSPPLDKMGLHASQTSQVIMEDCRVPAENMLGPEGGGFKMAMRALDSARAAVSAQAVGIAQGALDYAIEYTKQREAFGKPVIGNQGIQFLFADMGAQLAAARALAYQSAWMFDAGHPERAKYGAMAKLFCTEAAARIVGDALVMLGGYGYMREYPIEKMYRDVKALQIYEGTNHIQRVVIARHMLGTR